MKKNNSKLNNIRSRKGMAKRMKRNRAIARRRTMAVRKQRLLNKPLVVTPVTAPAAAQPTKSRKGLGRLLVAAAAMVAVMAIVMVAMFAGQPVPTKAPPIQLTVTTHQGVASDGSLIMEPDEVIEGGLIYRWNGESYVADEVIEGGLFYHWDGESYVADDPIGFEG